MWLIVIWGRGTGDVAPLLLLTNGHRINCIEILRSNNGAHINHSLPKVLASVPRPSPPVPFYKNQ